MPPAADQDTAERAEDRTDGSAGLADARRARASTLLRRSGLTVLVALVVVAAALGVQQWRSTGSDASVAPPSRERSTTTSTATTPTSTTSTNTDASTSSTSAPPQVTVPGITVGALTGGPGPIPFIHRIPTFDPVVFITIDDGAYAEEDALSVIRDQKVPVTLFLNQTYLKANGDYFARLQDAGAVIGSHTMSHANLRGKDPAFQHAQICDLVDEFRGRFGAAPTLFRPPYGNYDQVTLQQAASCGITTAVHWSAVADSGSIVTADGPLRPGDIILLHFKPGLGLKLRAVLAQIQLAGLRPARLADYIASAPRA